jgi:hypothetical protein
MPGAPVLQNAWATPGIVAAVNYGGSTDGSTIAAAGAWTPGNGRFQISGGLGSNTLTGYGSAFAYGARVALPIFGGGTSAFGVAAFGGVGGRASNRKAKASAVLDQNGNVIFAVDSTPSTTAVALGGAVGYRRAFGSTHGVSVYATPTYLIQSGGMKNGSLFRAAIGADVGITTALGATLGVDFGGKRARGLGGPSSTQYALGVSYALGRR